MQLAGWHESHYWLAAGWTMFHFLWIGTIVWIAALVLRSSLRRASPAVRYSAAVVLMLATTAVPAGLYVAVLAGIVEPPATSHAFHQASSFEVARAEPVAAPATLSESGGRLAGPANSVRGSLATPLPLPFECGPALTASIKAVQDLASRWLPWLWVAGTPVMFLVIGCGMTGAERLRRAGRILEDGDVPAACRRLHGVLRMSGRVAVAVCERIGAPLLVGVVRPMILLPPAVLAGCSPEQIEMVLLHELAHVRRWDNLVNLAQRVIEAALFFHPVIWWLSSWVRLEREECCDRVVLAHTASPQAYAEILATLALPGINPRHAAAAMADRHLVVRIRHVLNLEDDTMSVSRWVFIAAAGLLISCGCFAASFAQPADRGTAPTAEKSPA
ncbi:MAG TPA: M56 family metallopeptidase, partial [Gemmataceae bacterium]|nr:M56 family metallopeptidase [Gemmataceae bacterium]